MTTSGTRRRGLVARVIACLSLAVAVSCTPETGTFGGTVTGTVYDLSAEPVGFVTVYVVDASDGRKHESVDALSGANGRFRLDAPAGLWTLVATDFQGAAAFVYEVRIGNGEVFDVGPVYLQPCAAPGSGTNGEVYEECPDPASSDDLGYNAPSGPVAVAAFQPSYTDATLSVDPVGYDTLEVTSYDDANELRLDIYIPDYSPYFSEGVHVIAEYDQEFFATLYELQSGVIYVFREGTFSLEALQPEEGGTFRARITNAVFDWYDYQNGTPDGSFTATIAETSPAMTDSISVSEVSGPGGSGPPPQSYHFAAIEPEYTQVYLAPDGSLEVATYDVFASGEYVQLFFDVPPALNAAGSFAVQNTFGSDSTGWSFDLHAFASYTDVSGYEYVFVLANGTWNVSDPATATGDGFAASLTGATFYWQESPSSQPYSTLTLTLDSSGTMQGVADPAAPDDGGAGRIDWGLLKSGLTVQLGN